MPQTFSSRALARILCTIFKGKSPNGPSVRAPSLAFTRPPDTITKRPMPETFLTRIPTLSDSELEEYRRNYSRFELEAVEAALAELRKRGHGISNDEINSIKTSIHERDTGKSPQNPGQGSHSILACCRMDRRQIRHIAVMILALGLGGALTIYLTVGPIPADLLGYNLLDSKKSLRELELYGGKANVLSVEFQQWFAGLWHGRTLAATVAVLTVLLAFAFWFVASNQISDDGDRTGDEAKPKVPPDPHISERG